MAKYLLADREENGYDDSDFYAIFFDSESGTIRKEVYGSTRFPSPTIAPAEYLREIPQDIEAKAQAFLKARIFEQIQAEDKQDIDEPNDAQRGETLKINEAGNFKNRETGEIIEYLAGETGTVIWIGAFGKFYRNGYNHQGRHNRRVGLKLAGGDVIFIGLNKCSRAKEYRTESEIEAMAERAAKQGCYQVLFRVPGYIQF